MNKIYIKFNLLIFIMSNLHIIKTGDGKELYFTDEHIKNFPKYKENMIIILSSDLLMPVYNYITFNKPISPDCLTTKFVEKIKDCLGLDLFEDILLNNINILYSLKELNQLFNKSFKFTIYNNLNIGLTKLQYASLFSRNIENSYDLIDKLIKAGADINLPNRYGLTALMLASKYSNYTSTEKTVEMLIKFGADLNLIEARTDKTALIIASESQHKMADDILKPNNVGSFFKEELLKNELSKGCSSVKTIEMLINAKADVNLQDHCGNTALMLILKNKRLNKTSVIKITKMLINAGTNVNLQNVHRDTALIIFSRGYNNWSVAEHTFVEIIKILLNAKANVNLQNTNEYTALMHICARRFKTNSPPGYLLEVIKILVKAGANVKLRNDSNLTAYNLYQYKKYMFGCLAPKDSIDYLLLNGCD